MNSLTGKNVSFDNCYLHVELFDGRIISSPMTWYPELQRSTVEQISHFAFICDNTGVEWSDIDFHLSIESMLIGASKASAA
ncbi:DUF2442 domain-containing protein [Pontiella sulfatireligans]|uniref:DUF2442 domain-containing protein n=1 Tax=Pontiella sulfatireligans TaxID=2750658 RepID=A0A6C2UMK8_9BACT|nr:DUF2442 domain-containing protein [Pontiella sulfatireligans]VGO21229.1 hypothetical protein SCARR_03301 [Pontiella sulfatireligans]